VNHQLKLVEAAGIEPAAGDLGSIPKYDERLLNTMINKDKFGLLIISDIVFDGLIMDYGGEKPRNNPASFNQSQSVF